MTDFTALLENNRGSDIYTGGNIHGLYCYLEIIGSPPTLITLVTALIILVNLSSTNNDTAILRPVIAYLRTR